MDAELMSQLAGNKNEGPFSHPTCHARAIQDSFGIEDNATHIMHNSSNPIQTTLHQEFLSQLGNTTYHYIAP